MPRDIPFALAPVTVPEHRAQFCDDLENGRWQQCRQYLSVSRRGGETRFCAVGAALDYCGVGATINGGALAAPLTTLGKLDLTIALARRVQRMNDRGATFPEIAAYLRRAWRV